MDDRISEVRGLKLALLITLVFAVVEVVGSAISNSLALWSDAAHMFTDSASLGLSLALFWMGSRPASKRMTFGYSRVEILGALVSGLSIWAIAGYLVYEAFERLKSPPEVKGPWVLVIAFVGLLANLAAMKVLSGGLKSTRIDKTKAQTEHEGDSQAKSDSFDSSAHPQVKFRPATHGHSHSGHSNSRSRAGVHGTKPGMSQPLGHSNSQGHGHSHIGHAHGASLNYRAAYLHIITDLMGSVGAMIAGTALSFTGWNVIDPIVTLVFSVFMVVGSWELIKEALEVLLESAPRHLQPEVVFKELAEVDGVNAVHDLHIWTAGRTKVALSVHIIAKDTEGALVKCQDLLESHFGVKHTTIQVEHPDRFDQSRCLDCGSYSLPTT